MPLPELEKKLGRRFADGSLLEAALTHPSFSAENQSEAPDDNQRLEFLGDAVLDLLLADHVYRNYPEKHEGMLTVLRARVVSEAGLAAVARSLNLGAYLRLGRGERGSGGATRDSNLADAMEAVMAALYLDGGLPLATEVFERLFSDAIAALRDVTQWQGNPKGRLQQLAQAHSAAEPVYTTISVEGPQHAPVFTVEARVGALAATASGPSRRAAETLAAEQLLSHWPDNG